MSKLGEGSNGVVVEIVDPKTKKRMACKRQGESNDEIQNKRRKRW